MLFVPTGLLRLGGRHFWVVNSTLMLLKLMDEHYLGLVSVADRTGDLPGPGRAPGGNHHHNHHNHQHASKHGRHHQQQGQHQQGVGAGAGAGAGGGGGAGAGAGSGSQVLLALGPDVAQRCMELLRAFNVTTAQQVGRGNGVRGGLGWPRALQATRYDFCECKAVGRGRGASTVLPHTCRRTATATCLKRDHGGMMG